MDIMPGFTLTDIETSGARIRLRHAGSGPPLLLLHGNPLTHVAWHKVAPRLAERFHVVAADLRGCDLGEFQLQFYVCYILETRKVLDLYPRGERFAQGLRIY